MNESKEKPQKRATTRTKQVSQGQRLVSLDAYRGFIMIMLAASGFGIARLAALPQEAPVWQSLDYESWQQLGFHFRHTKWISQIGYVGVSFWDLIQPAFMFMVGVAMPYSFARRSMMGHSGWRQFGHALWRALVLVLMGVFLQSQRKPQTFWLFTDVLSQIGLGYIFLYLLMPRTVTVKLVAIVAILMGYGLFFYQYTVPENYDYAAVNATEETVLEGRFAPWSKNANAGYEFDVWFLNLFPQPPGQFEFHPGGYCTLNFVPSIATMLLGVLCGQLLMSRESPWKKLMVLMGSGLLCMILGILSGQYLCPIVKVIWTPSWVLFSGAWVIWMLALFYFVYDVLPLRLLAFPLAVVGMNSIAMYLMGRLMRGWTSKNIQIHFGVWIDKYLGPNLLADDMYGRLTLPTLAFVVFWLIAYWMYRQRYFVRV